MYVPAYRQLLRFALLGKSLIEVLVKQAGIDVASQSAQLERNPLIPLVALGQLSFRLALLFAPAILSCADA